MILIFAWHVPRLRGLEGLPPMSHDSGLVKIHAHGKRGARHHD